jgi:hypothetical protein
MVRLSFLSNPSNSVGAPRFAPPQLWHLFMQMAQKVCSPKRKTIAGNYLRWIASMLTGPNISPKSDFIAGGPVPARPHQTLRD